MEDDWKAWRALRQDPRISDVREVEEDFGAGNLNTGRRLSVLMLYRGHLAASDVAVEMQYSPANGAGTWRVGLEHVVPFCSIAAAPFDILEHARNSLRAAMIRWLAGQPE